MLKELAQKDCEDLRGGFTEAINKLSPQKNQAYALGPQAIQISVSPIIFTAPLLSQATNSFNFFGNSESFNGNFGSYFGIS